MGPPETQPKPSPRSRRGRAAGWARGRTPPLVRLGLAAVLVGLAVTRLAAYDFAKTRMDETFLLLLGAAALVLVVPWHDLKQLKAGAFELTIEKPAVRNAVDLLGPERELRVDDDTTRPVPLDLEEVRREIRRLDPLIREVQGSRVLWIDDKPEMVRGERRLLRSLGLDVVAVSSSAAARDAFDNDDDYDLLITDVKRKKEKDRADADGKALQGVDYVVREVRTDWDPHIAAIPVVFYSAYDLDQLVRFTAPARATHPVPHVANHPRDLVATTVTALWLARTGAATAPFGKRAMYDWKRERRAASGSAPAPPAPAGK